MDDELPSTVAEAARRLRAGELTSVALTAAMLARADEVGAYVTRFRESALEQARRADDELASGIDRGAYHGIPVGIKDVVAVAEGPTTANSLVLDPAWGAGRDAPVVRRLKAAGAVITGKTTTSEFALGGPDPSKPFPIPVNPWDTGRTTGGSSAGTGNGVAAGLFLAGLGSDTGGSIRIPAAYCGITGLKPTFGRVPKTGCVPLAHSLDHIGPMARTVEDCATMLAVISGHHPSDETSVARPPDDYAAGLGRDLAGVRVGVVRHGFLPPEADAVLADRYEAAVDRLRELGAEVVEVALPLYDEALTALWVTLRAEALAYHAGDLARRWADYVDLTRIAIARGVAASAADYVQAGRVRRAAQHELASLFLEVDAVVSPTIATGAPTHEDMKRHRLSDFAATTVFTGYWNAVGNPALVVPMGFTADGMPLSLQIACRPFEEALLLRIGDAYQRSTDWHLRSAPLSATAATRADAADADDRRPPAAEEEDVVVIRAAMRRLGLAPDEREFAAIVSSYAVVGEAIARLYEVPQARQLAPALVFGAVPPLVDWAL